MKQRFNTGDEVLVRSKNEPAARWAQGTVYKTWLVAPDGSQWRHDRYRVDESIMGYTLVNEKTDPRYGTYGVEVTEKDFYVEAAAPNPYRPCWNGNVEVTQIHELQLFVHDFGLDGTDTDLIAALEGAQLSTDLGTEHAGHARIVVPIASRARVSFNVLRLMLQAAQTE
jgi:hypothetical protein